MLHNASSLETALQMAETMRATGGASWFRGQTRNWPLLSSFVRCNPSDQSDAFERISRFWEWLHTVPALEDLASDDDAARAVAQHYGLATNLVDFSTEPKVAAFFSAHMPPPPTEGDDTSCIICLNFDELKNLCDAMKEVRPEVTAVKAVTVEVLELWRIQAQYGVFLEYPFDANFERTAFNFDRIIFPTERDSDVLSKLIPEEDIYPTQKSDLEILL